MKHLLCLLLLALPLAASAQTFEVETLQSSGPSEKRLDLVLLGDGYRAQDQQQLHQDALNLVNNLFNLTPFKEYRALFNVRLIHVVSKENGADYGTYGTVRDTALGANFNCNNIDRLLCVDAAAVKTVAAQNAPGYDLLVVLANDPKYGGSGGEVAAVSLASNAGEILRHELGHTLGKLADEYTDRYDHYPKCTDGGRTDCPEPNATLSTVRDQVKWVQWLDPSTPVPTTSTGSAAAIGVYQGCRYQTAGVYRPKDGDCLMKVLGHPYCSVCAEAMVRSFWNLASPVDSFSPPTPTVNATTCGPITFSVTPPFASSQWGYVWTVDGVAKAGDTPTFTTSTNALGQGAHQVSVVVSDNTPLVRSDPNNALKETQTWQVTVGSCAPSQCDTATACDSQGNNCTVTHKPLGAFCGAGSCKNGQKVAPAACDGNGGCVVSAPMGCGNYTCDDAGADCRVSCTQDSHCVSGLSCVTGVCQVPQQVELPKPGCGCGAGGGTGGAALGLMLLAWLSMRRRAQPVRVRRG